MNLSSLSVTLSQFSAFALFLLFSGCHPFKSRYAMDDLEYAAKYHEGAEKEDVAGKIKQAVDARHVKGLGGLFVSGGGQFLAKSDAPIVGAEVGYEYYPTSYYSQRISGLLLSDSNQGFAGMDVGARFQTPTRLAPFAGVGMYNGFSRGEMDADLDRRDNDEDNAIDEGGETESIVDGYILAVYPEFGVHFWLNGSGRITMYTRYFVTSEGRSQDQWLLGGQATVFSR